MDFSSIIQNNFINPLWDKTGYNLVNTLTYAAIALCALYFIWRIFEKKKIAIDKSFWMCALAFVLFGSSLRVLTDAVDAGTVAKTLNVAQMGAGVGGIFSGVAALAYPFILQSHLLDYGIFTVTPGIYVVTAILFLSAWALGRAMGKPLWAAYAGAAGALVNLILLLPMANYWLYAAMPILLMLAVGALLYFGLKWRNPMDYLPVMGQALDGAATWMAIDFFGPAMGTSYFEQHVISRGIGTLTPLGFGLFFLLKVGFSIVAVWAIRAEKMDERARNLALLVIAIIGFAPGLRDLLRMLCGT